MSTALNFVSVPFVGTITECSLEYSKIWLFALQGRQNKPIRMKFGMEACARFDLISENSTFGQNRDGDEILRRIQSTNARQIWLWLAKGVGQFTHLTAARKYIKVNVDEEEFCVPFPSPVSGIFLTDYLCLAVYILNVNVGFLPVSLRLGDT